MPRRTPLAALLALTLLALPLRAAADVTVFAAASLTTALDRVAAAWTDQTGQRVTLSYAGSSALARQIQQGAPADIFISASPDWMDALAASGDLRADTRRDILGNTLVLIAHGKDARPVTLDATLDLPALLGEGRLAMALVDAVRAATVARRKVRRFIGWAPSVRRREPLAPL